MHLNQSQNLNRAIIFILGFIKCNNQYNSCLGKILLNNKLNVFLYVNLSKKR